MGDTSASEDAEATGNGIHARYTEADGERRLSFDQGNTQAVIAQNIEGYAMLRVRRSVDGDELERYYGFEMALDHAGELLGCDPNALPIPEPAADMGM